MKCKKSVSRFHTCLWLCVSCVLIQHFPPPNHILLMCVNIKTIFFICCLLIFVFIFYLFDTKFSNVGFCFVFQINCVGNFNSWFSLTTITLCRIVEIPADYNCILFWVAYSSCCLDKAGPRVYFVRKWEGPRPASAPRVFFQKAMCTKRFAFC